MGNITVNLTWNCVRNSIGHNFKPRSYLQSQGHKAHLVNIFIWAIMFYCAFD